MRRKKISQLMIFKIILKPKKKYSFKLKLKISWKHIRERIKIKKDLKQYISDNYKDEDEDLVNLFQTMMIDFKDILGQKDEEILQLKKC